MKCLMQVLTGNNMGSKIARAGKQLTGDNKRNNKKKPSWFLV
jgi:hypothetical protein